MCRTWLRKFSPKTSIIANVRTNYTFTSDVLQPRNYDEAYHISRNDRLFTAGHAR